MMSPKRRFRETLLFGSPDKVPLSPGEPRESTLTAWHKQGLAEGVNRHQALLGILGIEEVRQELQQPIVDLAASFKMIPTFKEKVLEHKNGHYTVQDWMGAIAKGNQAMKREVMRVVPPLLKERGFIPKCDHGVPPDISWPNYVEYSRLLAKLTGWL